VRVDTGKWPTEALAITEADKKCSRGFEKIDRTVEGGVNLLAGIPILPFRG
jgi:hypothetical protein